MKLRYIILPSLFIFIAWNFYEIYSREDRCEVLRSALYDEGKMIYTVKKCKNNLVTSWKRVQE